MAGTDRRESIRLAIGAALLPFLAARPAAASAAATIDASAIEPPAGPMVYRRRLERALSGGRESVTVERDFEIRFTPLSDGGFLVSGRQSKVAVDVPPSLAQLATIEEQRVENGLFPIQLDSRGQIAGWPAVTRDSHLGEALDVVRRHFADAGMETGALIEALHGASGELVATLPNDLFAPTEPVREELRRIELPWGDQGEVITRFEAIRDPQSRLMSHARRMVTTRYGGEERCNVESWTLAAA